MKDEAQNPDPDSRNPRVSCISYLPHLVAKPTHIPFAFLQKETRCSPRASLFGKRNCGLMDGTWSVGY